MNWPILLILDLYPSRLGNDVPFIKIDDWQKVDVWSGGLRCRYRPERRRHVHWTHRARVRQYVARRHKRFGRTGVGTLNFKRVA